MAQAVRTYIFIGKPGKIILCPYAGDSVLFQVDKGISNGQGMKTVFTDEQSRIVLFERAQHFKQSLSRMMIKIGGRLVQN
ncbi:hypothetical protein [Aneurinibacillus migulanus]